jgi:hypothetical protein
MCLAVYLGSDRPAPEVAWDKERPAFHLHETAASDPVRGQFKGRYVYYAGSHQGCGCGFSKDGEPSEELSRCQANYDALAHFLGSTMLQGARLQLFTCWEGEQADEPESVRTVTLAQLADPSFELQQLELLNVAGDA